jgi:hypothetical protein
MRAVWWRETRELLVAATAVWAALVLIGALLPSTGLPYFLMVEVAALGGVIGLSQGLLDRRRRIDGFLLHRPIGGLALHVARSLSGITILLVGAFIAALSGLIDVRLAEARAERTRDILARVGRPWFEPQRDWGASRTYLGSVVLDVWGALFALVLLLGGWAVVRYATSRRRLPVAMFAIGALPIAGWSLVARCSTIPFAVVAASAFVLVVTSLSVLDLAGDRR